MLRFFLLAWLAVFLGGVARADWTASGTVNYRDREFDQTGFTGLEPLLPARFVDIEVVDAGHGSVIGSGATVSVGAGAVFESSGGPCAPAAWDESATIAAPASAAIEFRRRVDVDIDDLFELGNEPGGTAPSGTGARPVPPDL